MQENKVIRSLSKSVKQRIRSLAIKDILTPVVIAFIILVAVAYIGDNILGVWQFIHGYISLLKGVTGPMTPYTDAMSIITLVAVPVVLYRKKVNLVDSVVIAIATVLAAMTSFEFWWDIFFLVGHPITSWFGFPEPFWHYVFAFNSLVALWFVGIKYWRFSWPSILLFLSYPIVFIAWYMSGYPQPWYSYTIDSAYVWNATVKVLAFLALMAPVLAFGLHGNSEGVPKGSVSTNKGSNPEQ